MGRKRSLKLEMKGEVISTVAASGCLICQGLLKVLMVSVMYVIVLNFSLSPF